MRFDHCVRCRLHPVAVAAASRGVSKLLKKISGLQRLASALRDNVGTLSRLCRRRSVRDDDCKSVRRQSRRLPTAPGAMVVTQRHLLAEWKRVQVECPSQLRAGQYMCYSSFAGPQATTQVCPYICWCYDRPNFVAMLTFDPLIGMMGIVDDALVLARNQHVFLHLLLQYCDSDVPCEDNVRSRLLTGGGVSFVPCRAVPCCACLQCRALHGWMMDGMCVARSAAAVVLCCAWCRIAGFCDGVQDCVAVQPPANERAAALEGGAIVDHST